MHWSCKICIVRLQRRFGALITHNLKPEHDLDQCLCCRSKGPPLIHCSIFFFKFMPCHLKDCSGVHQKVLTISLAHQVQVFFINDF